MKTVYHYFGRYGENFKGLLESSGIKADILYSPHNPDPIYTFDLISPSKRFEEQYATISLYAEPLAIWTKYSSKELETSQWLSLLPHRTCVDILNYDEAMLYYCTKTKYATGWNHIHNQEQIDLFRIRTLPKRTKAAFYTGDSGFEILFCDDRVYDLVQESGLKGVCFKTVLSKTGKVHDRFFQVTSNEVIKREQIVLGRGERFSECPYCGSRQIIEDNRSLLIIRKEAIDNQRDFYMTESIFGEGVAHPLYLLSNRFYKLLKENKLLFSSTVKPVVIE